MQFHFVHICNLTLTLCRYLTDVGHQVINRQTGLALYAGRGKDWEYEFESKRIIDRRFGRALDRGWTQEDGVIPGTYTPHNAINQKWSYELVCSEQDTNFINPC